MDLFVQKGMAEAGQKRYEGMKNGWESRDSALWWRCIEVWLLLSTGLTLLIWLWTYPLPLKGHYFRFPWILYYEWSCGPIFDIGYHISYLAQIWYINKTCHLASLGKSAKKKRTFFCMCFRCQNSAEIWRYNCNCKKDFCNNLWQLLKLQVIGDP